MSATMTLAQARDLVGLMQTELDRRAGLPAGTTHDLESGRNKNPSYFIVVRVVRALRDAGLVGIQAEQIFPVPEAIAS